VNELEEILLANGHIIDEFSWVTAPIDRFAGSRLLSVSVDDMTNHMPFPQDLYGIQPNYFETANKTFTVAHQLSPEDTQASWLEKKLGHPNESGLPLGE